MLVQIKGVRRIMNLAERIYDVNQKIERTKTLDHQNKCVPISQ